MVGLIFAAGVRPAPGNGRRPSLQLGGLQYLERLAASLAELGCDPLLVLLRDDVAEPERAGALAGARFLRIETQAPLAALAHGLDQCPAGPVMLALGPTVIPPDAWRLFHQGAGRALDSGADLVLAVTARLDVGRPLWISRDEDDLWVNRVSFRQGDALLKAGGLAAFGGTARAALPLAQSTGVHTVAAFLRRLVSGGMRVAAVDLPVMMDLNQLRDLKAAEALLD